jgi:hypothetical protein
MKPLSDPLLRKTASERLHYATGELLGADDFRDEQTYHRRQLARALLHQYGSGTLAGLRVVARHRPAHGYLSNGAFAIGDTTISVDTGTGTILAGEVITFAGDSIEYLVARALASNVVTIASPGLRAAVADNTAITVQAPDEMHLEVRPGLALDRAGRLIEVPREACLRLRRWFDFIAAQPPDSALLDAGDLRAAFRDGAVVADIFLAFHPCDRGYTPAFASGPFDALDASQPSRVRDAYELSLVLRTEANPPTAFDPWAGIAGGTVEDRLAAAHEVSLDAWDTLALPPSDHVGDWHENPAGFDPTAVLLARLRIPSAPAPNAASAPVPDWSAAAWPNESANLDNTVRNFLLPPAAIRRVTGP